MFGTNDKPWLEWPLTIWDFSLHPLRVDANQFLRGIPLAECAALLGPRVIATAFRH